MLPFFCVQKPSSRIFKRPILGDRTIDLILLNFNNNLKKKRLQKKFVGNHQAISFLGQFPNYKQKYLSFFNKNSIVILKSKERWWNSHKLLNKMISKQSNLPQIRKVLPMIIFSKILVGPSCIGKSSLLQRYIDGTFLPP